MSVLVTGASGFLGSHIAEILAGSGHAVRLLLRPSSSREFLKFDHEVAIGDVTDTESLGAAAQGVDVVVHAAGLIKARSAAEFAAVNDQGTANIVQACTEVTSGVRFIYISSLAARGPGDGSSPSAPVTEYGRTKLAGEKRLLESSLAERSTIFRMPVIYGPRDPALLPVFLGAKFRFIPLLNGGRNKISLIYATDAATAVQSVIDGPTALGPVTYTPEDGSVHTWRDLVGAVEDAVGHRATKVPLPRVAFAAAASVTASFAKIRNRAEVFTPEKVDEMAQEQWVCFGETLTADTGWRPGVQIGEGASLTYRWYRYHRWL